MEEGGIQKCVKYNDYLATESACIGQYAPENGPACVVCHFSKVLDKKVPETTARRKHDALWRSFPLYKIPWPRVFALLSGWDIITGYSMNHDYFPLVWTA